MSEETKDKLIAVAGPLFAELGYDGAGVRAICKKAGLSQVAVNYHFGNKENLYKACIESSMETDSCEQFYEQFESLGDKTVAAEDRLMQLLEISMDCFYYQEVQWQDLLFLREMLSPTECCEEVLKGATEKESEVIQGILSELLPKSAPTHIKVKFQFSIFGQAYMYTLGRSMLPWIVSPEDLEKEFSGKEIAKFIFDVTMAGIRRYSDAINN